jgi:AraC-like DNA-binding protein
MTNNKKSILLVYKYKLMSMDILSDILKQVRLDGGVYFRCEFSSPWGMDIKPMPVAEFHVVVRGTCWLHLPGEAQPVALQGGDLVAFPHGDAHSLTDAADNCVTLPAEDIIAGQNLDNYGPVTHGGKGLPTSVLCGYFKFDKEHPHPLVSALPRLIHIRGADSHDLAWLQTTLNFMSHETRAAKPGADAVVNGLVRVLFVQMMRAHIEQTQAPTGLLAALADRQIGEALQQMHKSPQQRWSLETLARRVGMSRSAFASRFHQLAGETPMQYLTHWRMRKACELLRETRLGMADIAEQAGYQSEAAFGKAFKKSIGTSPGAYRKGSG